MECPDMALALGSGILYPFAREAALKLKEVALVHAEAMQSAEVKHGPIALVTPSTLCLFLMDGPDARTEANIHEVRARGGKTLLVCTGETPDSARRAAESCFVIGCEGLGLSAGLALNVFFQLYSLAVATRKGLDPDRPRNLAKCVTV
jgi:glucosamine--fructose-6-phosphate aminotransferase (isomerizing)